jgi:hypothetical protein
MRHFTISMIGLAALVWTLPATAASDWHNYVYPKDGFSISAPAKPKYSARTITLKNGKVEDHQYAISEPDRTYIVTVAKYPAGAKVSADAAINGAVNSLKGKITARRPVALGNVKGSDCDASGADWAGHFRAYVSGTTLYQLITIWQKDKPPSDYNRFNSSFRLL